MVHEPEAGVSHARNRGLREARAASDVLMGRDRDAARFVGEYAGWTAAPGGEGGSRATTARLAHAVAATVEEAVIQGDRENIITLVERELDAGADPFALVRERLIPAITEVGARYERRDYFLPQLLRSAETMQTAFARLRPLLEKSSDVTERPVAVFATVEGDIHDIGKNIVALMLGNHGFNVVDLGKDVKAEDIVRAAVEHNADIIGLSALMTTTMVRWKTPCGSSGKRGCISTSWSAGQWSRPPLPKASARAIPPTPWTPCAWPKASWPPARPRPEAG